MLLKINGLSLIIKPQNVLFTHHFLSITPVFVVAIVSQEIEIAVRTLLDGTDASVSYVQNFCLSGDLEILIDFQYDDFTPFQTTNRDRLVSGLPRFALDDRPSRGGVGRAGWLRQGRAGLPGLQRRFGHHAGHSPVCTTVPLTGSNMVRGQITIY